MYKVSGELDFDVRSGVANARLAARELENVGQKAMRSGDFVDKFAKRMFGARTASEYLAKTLARLGPSLIGGAVGGTALGAIVNQAKTAAEEMGKLADALDKAVGAKAGATIGDTLGKINSLTTAVEDSAEKISKQSPLASVAAFFMNEDADRAAKAFVSAVEERIRLGQKLVDQTAEQNAQTEIASSLEGRLGEIYKININYRKRLAEISDIKGITEAQRDQLKLLAEQARQTQTRITLTKELANEEKKAAEERKKSDEEFSKTTLNILDSLQKQEEALFKKNEDAFKRAQQEKIKATEDANRKILESSRKAASELDKQDRERQDMRRRSGEGAEFLLQGRDGQQALAVARKQREREANKEDFRLREESLRNMAKQATIEEGRTVTKRDILKRLASQQAAAQMPTMGQRVMAEEAGISPELLAGGVAAQKAVKAKTPQEPLRGVLDSLKKSIEALSKKIPAAVPQ